MARTPWPSLGDLRLGNLFLPALVTFLLAVHAFDVEMGLAVRGCVLAIGAAAVVRTIRIVAADRSGERP